MRPDTFPPADRRTATLMVRQVFLDEQVFVKENLTACLRDPITMYGIRELQLGRGGGQLFDVTWPAYRRFYLTRRPGGPAVARHRRRGLGHPHARTAADLGSV